MEVIDVDDFKRKTGDDLGSAEFELADIVGSLHNMKILRLRDRKNNETGKCIVRLDKVSEHDKKNVKLRLGLSNVPKSSFFASRNSFIKIFKLRLTSKMLEKVKNNDLKVEQLQMDSWLLVYKSRSYGGKNVNFKEINILASKLCNDNFDLPIKIEVWKYKNSGNHKMIGSCHINLNDLVSRKN